MKPIRWWMRLLKPFSRCQSAGLNWQALQGVKLADIRIRYYHHTWWVCHGPVIYIPLTKALYRLKNAEIYNVRLLFEGGHSHTDYLDWMLKTMFSDFNFYCGRDKHTWKRVLELEDLNIEQIVGSMQSWYGKICPWLWNLFNKKKKNAWIDFSRNKQKYTLFDFI